jgi:hypothetical protein
MWKSTLFTVRLSLGTIKRVTSLSSLYVLLSHSITPFTYVLVG